MDNTYANRTTRVVHSMFSDEERAGIGEAVLEKLSASYGEMQRKARALAWYLERQRKMKPSGPQE